MAWFGMALLGYSDEEQNIDFTPGHPPVKNQMDFPDIVQGLRLCLNNKNDN